MKIDIDDVMRSAEALLPWDLTVTVGGRDYATRRPTVGQIAGISAMGKLSNDVARGVILAMFEGAPPPPVKTWSDEQLAGVMAVYLSYFNEQVKKKCRMLANRVAGGAAGTDQTPSGVGSSG